jgi:hypothetical protein
LIETGFLGPWTQNSTLLAINQIPECRSALFTHPPRPLGWSGGCSCTTMLSDDESRSNGSFNKSPSSPPKLNSAGSSSSLASNTSRPEKRWSMSSSGWLPPNTSYKVGTFTNEVKQIVTLPNSSSSLANNNSDNGVSADGQNQAPTIRYDATKVHVVRVLQAFTGSLSGQLTIEVNFPSPSPPPW